MKDGQWLRGLVVGPVAVGVVAVLAAGPAEGQIRVPDGEWHHFGRDGANTKYSPLDQITAANFTDLEIAWRWTSLSRAVVEENERIRPSAFKSSPLMADGLVFVSTALGQAAALDAGTGEPVWTYDPRGEIKWIFHTIPQGDEFGVDSWQNESWRYSGHTNVRSYMAVDEELGYIYLPTGTPSNDWYGGRCRRATCRASGTPRPNRSRPSRRRSTGRASLSTT